MSDAFGTGWIIAIAVAVLPALIGIIGSGVSREARTPPAVRTLRALTESLEKTPEGSDARNSTSKLVAAYADAIKPTLVAPRRLNHTNVALSVVLLVITAVALGLLIGWITTAGEWSILAWIVTITVGLFLILLSAASVGTWYSPQAPKSTASTRASV